MRWKQEYNENPIERCTHLYVYLPIKWVKNTHFRRFNEVKSLFSMRKVIQNKKLASVLDVVKLLCIRQ